MKYLRMDLDISADLRVVSLSKMAEIPIEEAIGIAILIWVGAAKKGRKKMGIKMHNDGILDYLDSETPEGPTYDVELDGHLLDFMDDVSDILSKNVDILHRARRELMRKGPENALSVLVVDGQVEILREMKHQINLAGEGRRKDAALSKF